MLNVFAKRYTPAELERRMVDHTDPLSKLTVEERRAVSRQAVLYRDLENEVLLTPTVTRAWNRLQDYATAPAGRRPSVSRLRSALSGLVEAGVLSTLEAERIIDTYRQGWDDQRRAQSVGLAVSIAGRTFRQAQAVALLAEVETLNAESDPIENGLSNEQRRYYVALRGAYVDNLTALLNEATLSGCGISPNGLGVNPSAVIRSELRRE